MKLQVGQKVKYTSKAGQTEEGHVGFIDGPSQTIQLQEWLDAGHRTRWEPEERFVASK